MKHQAWTDQSMDAAHTVSTAMRHTLGWPAPAVASRRAPVSWKCARMAKLQKRGSFLPMYSMDFCIQLCWIEF